YWPDKNSVSVERNVKFVSPTIVINTLPPSYASTMAPAQAPAQAPAAPPYFAAQLPPAQPLAAQAPASPPAPPTALQAPPRVFIPASPPPSAPPSTPTSQTREILDEDEVEQTITPRRITVSTVPAAGPSSARRSGRTSRVPGFYRQLAQEDEDDAEHVDFVFTADLSEFAIEAFSELIEDPRTLNQARSRTDWPLWQVAMDRELETLERAGKSDYIQGTSGAPYVPTLYKYTTNTTRILRYKYKIEYSNRRLVQ
ncbi:hypothetical protein BGY98DRAFT_1168515, partial [Russula aff. rugulosa BPL654]